MNTQAAETRALRLLERVFEQAQTGLQPVCKHTLLAFSGGKDSVVCAHLVRRFGITDAVRDNCLSFHRVERQVREAGRELNLQVDHVDRFGRNWIWKEPGRTHYLWPELKVQAKFYKLAQQTTVANYALGNGYTRVVFGRRRQENCVPASVYKVANGLTHIMPIWDWSTEEVWSYIRTYGLPVPDIYDNPIGKVEGATRWNLITPSKFRLHPLRLIGRYCDLTLKELLELRPQLAEHL